MRILLTEDDLALAANLKKMLQDSHFSVYVCHDGEDGLFQILEYPYDLAIIDIGFQPTKVRIFPIQKFTKK